MLRLLWNLSNRVRLFLRTYMPTNILLDALRTRRGLKWGVPAMLIAALYLLGAWLLTVWISDGGPGWLNLLVLLFICYAVLAVMPMMVGRVAREAAAGLRLSA
jgi:ABC-type transport system involved in cytochrome bd biosynthesis fused ATPase/permease subunit